MSEKTPLYDLALQARAVFAEEAGWLVPAHFGDVDRECRSACEQAALFDVSHRGKIELAGPDALIFLHNLCTNDVKNLAVGAGCEAFLTTAKARVVAHILVGHFRHGDRQVVWLDFVPGMAEKVFQHLNHFLISEQVELADRTREIAQIHLCGPQARALLEKVLGEPLPDLPQLHQLSCSLRGTGASPAGNAGQASRLHHGHIRRHDPLGQPGYDLFCPTTEATDSWQRLADAGAVPAGRDAFEVLRVEAGTPVFGKDIDEDRLVMEVGRTQQAVCFTKGCFLGQEPIVMARDRGHVNRILLGLKISGQQAVTSGARLFKDGQEVGQVTSSVVSPRLGQAIALAYLRRGSQEPGTLLQVEAQTGGREAVVAPLPLVQPITWGSSEAPCGRETINHLQGGQGA